MPTEINHDVLVFRTDLERDEQLLQLKPLLEAHPSVRHWNVDRQDVDRVLRVVVHRGTPTDAIIRIVRHAGHLCEELPD